MNWLDSLTEAFTRRQASHVSRRSFLSSLGKWAVGASVLPVLPVARAQNEAPPSEADMTGIDDPTSCNYWRYCALDGYICACCGGTATSCPPGTVTAPLTWVGTCHNPVDGRDYIISYNDCCGKGECGICPCLRTERDKPVYHPQLNNDINWCMGAGSLAYHCTIGAIVGLAES
ncbi:MAG: methylamine dehydrogenase light chain [Deinococcales bacterium]